MADAHKAVTENLVYAMVLSPNWEGLSPEQKAALRRAAAKVAALLTRDAKSA